MLGDSGRSVHPLTQFQPRLEVNPVLVIQHKSLACLRVAPLSRLVMAWSEAAEAPNLDASAINESFGHVVEDVLHGGFDVGRVEPGITLLQDVD